MRSGFLTNTEEAKRADLAGSGILVRRRLVGYKLVSAPPRKVERDRARWYLRCSAPAARIRARRVPDRPRGWLLFAVRRSRAWHPWRDDRPSHSAGERVVSCTLSHSGIRLVAFLRALRASAAQANARLPRCPSVFSHSSIWDPWTGCPSRYCSGRCCFGPNP